MGRPYSRRAADLRLEISQVSEEFSRAAARALEDALSRRVAALVQAQSDHFDRMDRDQAARFREAAARAIARSASDIGERLRDTDLWEGPTVRLQHRDEQQADDMFGKPVVSSG